MGKNHVPQVSGVKFKFDPSKPPGHRIEARHVWVVREDVCEPLDLARRYSVATKHYLIFGKDGFDCLQVLPLQALLLRWSLCVK